MYKLQGDSPKHIKYKKKFKAMKILAWKTFEKCSDISEINYKHQMEKDKAKKKIETLKREIAQTSLVYRKPEGDINDMVQYFKLLISIGDSIDCES